MIRALGIEGPRAAGIAVAVAVHAAILAAGIWVSRAAPPTEPAAIRIALASMPAPEEESAPEPESEPQPEPVPEPLPEPEPEPAPQPEPAPEPMPAPPEPMPMPQPVTESVVASSAPAEAGETRVASAAAAPPKAPPPPPMDARAKKRQATYYGQILAWLDRHKRYPQDARRQRLEGVAEVFISIDREGRVRDCRLVNGSGHEMLDEASLAMVRRADPLPAMPREIPGDGMEFVVPVEFFMKKGGRR